MFIDIAPPVTDANAELLEHEFIAIAVKLGIEGVDIAGCVEDGIELISSFMIYYSDDQDDDDELAAHAGQIMAEFLRLQTQNAAVTREYEKSRAKIGRLILKLDRDGA
jgi:orotate phosphoribosyltransferase-like protein